MKNFNQIPFQNINDIIKDMQPYINKLMKLQTENISKANIMMDDIDNEDQKKYLKDCLSRAKRGEQMDINTIINQLNNLENGD